MAWCDNDLVLENLNYMLHIVFTNSVKKYGVCYIGMGLVDLIRLRLLRCLNTHVVSLRDEGIL